MKRRFYCPGALMALYRSGFDREQTAAAMGITIGTLMRWEIRAGLREGTRAQRGRRLSKAEFEALWFNPDIGISDIAAQLGITASAVGQRAAARGLPPRTAVGCEKRFRAITDPAFAAMYRAHVCARDLAAHYGCSVPVVHRTARRLGLTPRAGNRGSVIPLLRWQMMQQAARTRAAIVAADMADSHHPGRRAAA